MARLDVRLLPSAEVPTRVEIAPAIRFCLQTSRKRRLTANVVKAVQIIGNATILVLIRLVDLDAGASYANKGLVYGILAISFVTVVALGLAYTFSFEREAYRHNSAARALERLRDTYQYERHRAADPQRLQELLDWVKRNVNEIERLLDDARVHDIDLQFQPIELPMAGAGEEPAGGEPAQQSRGSAGDRPRVTPLLTFLLGVVAGVSLSAKE